jgi:hypothetical protein
MISEVDSIIFASLTISDFIPDKMAELAASNMLFTAR